VTIRAIDRPRRQSGQSIINDILDNIDEITSEHIHLQFKIIWIPGYMGIEGIELIDSEAKKAATNPTLSQSYNFESLKSAWIHHIKMMAKKQWQTVWNKNIKTATALRRIMKGRHAKIGPSLYNEITNRHGAVMIVQLRTGHCGLNNNNNNNSNNNKIALVWSDRHTYD
jgi:hypothetical protein